MDNSNKILNPSTGRYVKKTSVLGKLILSGKTPPKAKKEPKSCSDSQIRNPKSGRCIKKSGKLARSLGNTPMTSNGSFASSSPLALPVIPNSFVSPPPTTTLPVRNDKGKLKALDDLFGLNEEENAANKIKGLFKARLQKKKYDEQNAANKLKAVFQRRLQQRENANQRFATRELQSAIRRRNQMSNMQTTDKAVNVLQKAFRNKLSKNRERDAAMSRQTEKLKGLIDTSRNIVAQQNAQSKAISTIGAAIKRRDAVKDYSTTKRKAATAKFYDSANRKIKEAMPGLIGAGIATGIGLSGRI